MTAGGAAVEGEAASLFLQGLWLLYPDANSGTRNLGFRIRVAIKIVKDKDDQNNTSTLAHGNNRGNIGRGYVSQSDLSVCLYLK